MAHTNPAPKTKTAGKAAAKGDTVSVDYEGRTEDGTLFDTSIESVARKDGIPLREKYDPLSFEVGAGQMIKGFDDAVVGMRVGDEKSVKMAPKDAYGERDQRMVITVPTHQLEASLGEKPEAGAVIMTPSGQTGTIVSTGDEDSKVDFNHFLAGKTLVFRIIMRKVG